MQIPALSGALYFRWTVMVTLIAVFYLVFLSYSDKISIDVEKASIQQTKNSINSTLTLLFAKYAVAGELFRLSQLDGSDPFKLLNEHGILPATYQGKIKGENLNDRAAGWYYDEVGGHAIYKSFYDSTLYRFKIALSYRDVNKSGLYEADTDEYLRLEFIQLPQQ